MIIDTKANKQIITLVDAILYLKMTKLFLIDLEALIVNVITKLCHFKFLRYPNLNVKEIMYLTIFNDL